MKKLLAILILSFIVVFTAHGQSERNCLFAYETKNADEFEAVIEYMESFGVKVISTCKEENLIFVVLIGKYKDPLVLFRKIERAFSGKCYYKSNADVIMQYEACEDVYVKELIKQQE